jgi:hypothetical protein
MIVSGVSAGDEDTEDDEDDEDEEGIEYGAQGDPRATTLPRGMQVAGGTGAASATNSLPRQSGSSGSMYKAHSVYHFLPQHGTVKSARYRPPGFTRNNPGALGGPKRAFSAPGLQLQARSRRSQAIAHSPAASNVSSGASASAGKSLPVCSISSQCRISLALREPDCYTVLTKVENHVATKTSRSLENLLTPFYQRCFSPRGFLRFRLLRYFDSRAGEWKWWTKISLMAHINSDTECTVPCDAGRSMKVPLECNRIKYSTIGIHCCDITQTRSHAYFYSSRLPERSKGIHTDRGCT